MKPTKQISLAQRKSDWPNCCFCGGSAPNETWDHQPSILLFPRRDRPRGFEFPACERCNQQTKQEEALLALLCWMIGSQRTQADPNTQLMRSALAAAWRRYGHLFPRQKIDLVGSIDVAVPLIRRRYEPAACLLAAKFGLALHFHLTGKILSDRGLVTTFFNWRINDEAAEETYKSIMQLPHSIELNQGQKTSEQTFFCRYFQSDDEGITFAVVLHEAIALIGKVVEDPSSHAVRYARNYRPSPEFGIAFCI